MRLEYSVFSAHKSDLAPETFEDSYFPIEDFSSSMLVPAKFAVADGASEALLSGKFADIAVHSFGVSDHSELDFQTLLKLIHGTWEKWKLEEYLPSRQREGRPIKWYEEQGLADGAFCAFLGLIFLSPVNLASGFWKAVAIGDSCLFQVRDGKLLRSFPLRESSSFDSRPFLISSNPIKNENILARVRKIFGTWVRNDIIFLMTDALALWFIKQHEAGNRPWEILSLFGPKTPKSAFYDFVRDLRSSALIRNDDTTLMKLALL